MHLAGDQLKKSEVLGPPRTVRMASLRSLSFTKVDRRMGYTNIAVRKTVTNESTASTGIVLSYRGQVRRLAAAPSARTIYPSLVNPM